MYSKLRFLVNQSSNRGLGDDALGDVCVRHVDHSLSMSYVLDTEDLSGSSVVKRRDDLVGVGLAKGLGDRPAQGHVLVNDGLSVIFELW